jgi:hypothetical protein
MEYTKAYDVYRSDVEPGRESRNPSAQPPER